MKIKTLNEVIVMTIKNKKGLSSSIETIRKGNQSARNNFKKI